MRRAFITGVAGLELSIAERDLVAEARPAGLILFARNIESKDQVRRLVSDFKAAVASDRILVLVDQEGGRVQRIRPPLASLLPPAAAYATHFADNLEAAAGAARLVARLLASELRRFSINADCAPVLDLPVPGAHDIIGNRAFGLEPQTVVALGRAFAEGLMGGGVLPIMKHIPGHGRAAADSHLELPIVSADASVLAEADLAPFRALAHLPAAMTAHVVFTAFDAGAPASTSPTVIRDIVRGVCGFDGLLMSDDLGMRALSGTFAERTAAVLDAGSDLALHCSGNLAEMREVALASPSLSGLALARFERACAITQRSPQPYDEPLARSTLQRLIAHVA